MLHVVLHFHFRVVLFLSFTILNLVYYIIWYATIVVNKDEYKKGK